MTSIFIGTPCYRSSPEKAHNWALETVQGLNLAEASYGSVLECARVDHCRERLVADFIDSDRDALLFRDDDIDCRPELIGRMIDRLSSEKIVTVDYRKRIREATIKATEGLGLTLIRREVILALHHEYAELTHYVEGRPYVGIFDPVYVTVEGGHRIKKPEDAAFFARARGCGFSVAVVSPAAVIHAGLTSFF